MHLSQFWRDSSSLGLQHASTNGLPGLGVVSWDCLTDTSAYKTVRSQTMKAALPGGFAWGGPTLTTPGSPSEGSDTAYTLPFSLLFPPRAHLLILQYLAPKRMCACVRVRACVFVRARMHVCERQVFIKIQNVSIL